MDDICHNGFISRINSNTLYVIIVSQSACSECHAKGFCSVADQKDKEIEITGFKKNYQVGQEVTVVMRESDGLKAILIGYFLPFLVLIISLFITIGLTGNEITGALVSIGMVVLYYGILYISRNKLQKSFRFELKET